MNNSYKIIFVCEWNTCRSAMAKYIFKKLLKTYKQDDKIFTDSAGCRVKYSQSIGIRTAATLKAQNITLDENHRSKPFTLQQYNDFDCVLALDDVTLKILKRISHGDPENKIRLFKDGDGNDISVEDPGPTGEHLKAFTEISIGCQNFFKELGHVG